MKRREHTSLLYHSVHKLATIQIAASSPEQAFKKLQLETHPNDASYTRLQLPEGHVGGGKTEAEEENAAFLSPPISETGATACHRHR